MRNFSLDHHYDTALQFADHFDERYKPYLYALYKKLQEGQVCIRMEKVKSEIPDEYLAIFPWNIPKILPETNGLIVECEGNLYLQRYYQYESKIIEKIKDLIGRPQSPAVNQNIPSPKEADGTINWQSIAIIISLTHYFTIITGGPGTGKTTTVAKILEQLVSMNTNLKIGLAAPTGKAAARMTESLQNAGSKLPDTVRKIFNSLEPLTIHRLLGTIKGSIYFRHDKKNPLPLDVLIIDECSMIDMALFAKLLDAVGEDTRLILLGDRNQLASVEAGSLFGDLCDIAGKLEQFSVTMVRKIDKLSGENSGINEQSHPTALSDHVIELQKSYRFSKDKGIGRLSHAVILQDEKGVRDFLMTHDEQVTIDTEYSSDIFKVFTKQFEEYLKEEDIATALKKLNHCKVLCATREGFYGLFNTNLRIEKLLEEKGLIQHQKDFYENRPVLITKNNYQLQLYNGDTGIVRKDKTGKLKVWFEINNQLTGFAPSLINNVETAYSITIHKSQGSEFDEILILLPEHDLPLLTKELIYTAITRAKKHVIIQSSEASLLGAIQKSVERGSGIKYRLQ